MAETIKSIIDWHETTFPDATLEAQIKKFKVEYLEYRISNPKDITELADMFIVACGIARFDYIKSFSFFTLIDEILESSSFIDADFMKAVDEKMEKNRKRIFEYNNGMYQHREGIED